MDSDTRVPLGADGSVVIHVRHRGAVHDLEVRTRPLPEASAHTAAAAGGSEPPRGVVTGSALHAAVALAFPDLVPSTIKLVRKGELVRRSDDDVAVATGDVVLCTGSTAEELASLTAHGRYRIVNDFVDASAVAPSGSAAAAASSKTPIKQTHGGVTTGFGELRPLPGFADMAAAEAILHRVASSPAVQAVMRAHRWFVPLLSEMPAEGRVGVDPVCILGLNVNKGAEIRLRLRTDDLLGFRKFGVIMKTVWHELAHNALSEHTGEFYDLCASLEREGAALDWTQGEAHVLGGAGAAPAAAAAAGAGRVQIAPNSRYDVWRAADAAAAAAGGGTALVGGGGVLGGDAGVLAAGVEAVELAAAAARARTAHAVSTSSSTADEPSFSAGGIAALVLGGSAGAAGLSGGTVAAADRPLLAVSASAPASASKDDAIHTGMRASETVAAGSARDYDEAHMPDGHGCGDDDHASCSRLHTSSATAATSAACAATATSSSTTGADVATVEGPPRDAGTAAVSVPVTVDAVGATVGAAVAAAAAADIAAVDDAARASATPAATTTDLLVQVPATQASSLPDAVVAEAPPLQVPVVVVVASADAVAAAPSDMGAAEVDGAAFRSAAGDDPAAPSDSDAAWAAAQAATEEQRSRIQSAVDAVIASRLSAGQAPLVAVTTLAGIVQRALAALTEGGSGAAADGGDRAKFLQVRASNQAFVERTGGDSHALAVLTAAGFRQEGDGWLRLPPQQRVDVGRLWMAREVLAAAAEVLA